MKKILAVYSAHEFSWESKNNFSGYKDMVKFDLNSFYVM